MQAAGQLAEGEWINAEEKLLLLTAALLHDTGFLVQREEHELFSCELARGLLPEYGYEQAETDRICCMIMATRLPQSPKDKSSEILCDADLDYLGRDDFFGLSDRLYQELLADGQVSNRDEWNRQQADFIGNHRYFTKTAIHLRQSLQEHHVDVIKAQINSQVLNENQ
jgi:predicted metal-dependent HD superfamily phosphohydrolase